ncbi:MAG: hypothetical protein AB8B55_21870 [Mariniblastus sp.]
MNTPQNSSPRKKLFVHREVQGTLIVRSVLRWYFYMVAVLLAVSIITVLRDPAKFSLGLLYDSFIYFSPAIIASIVLLPVFIYDVVKSTNRVAGPIVRLRTEMQKLSNGRDVTELRFREGDHWNELAADFNALAEKVMEERSSYCLNADADFMGSDANETLELVSCMVDELE